MKKHALMLIGLVCILGCSDQHCPVSGIPSLAFIKPDGSGTHATIQDAIDKAEDGDVIELDDGVFRGDGNRDLNFSGKAISVRSRSGNPYACVIDCQGDSLDPHQGFFFHNGEDSSASIEKLGITNGFARLYGGCIRFDNYSSATLVGLVLTESAARDGGAIACWHGSDPVIRDCVFIGNRSIRTGSLACYESSPTIVGCHFRDNEGYWGGAISILRESQRPALIEECTFELNQANDGGAIYFGQATTEVRECLFRHNVAREFGGAWFCAEASPRLTACTSHHNYALVGGALHCQEDCIPILTQCTLCYETGMYVGAAIHLVLRSRAECRQCIIAFCAGGQAVESSDTTSIPTLQCCNLHGNRGGDWTGAIEGQLGTFGNISAWPWFCDAEFGDYHLQASSPCSGDSTGCGRMGAWPVGCD
ncbi:right-handed parallel beta-helix repeat-containing protein [Candidatus Eisenbacteria bacterium]|uniref:Right-handed parallel beta-helix repeat-containing protein n=1 Tax=Eiseniibacteriota bacterium TaxID=2212470 RepID=A0ABV6YJR2_UNCEI